MSKIKIWRYNGMNSEFKIVNGTAYHMETPDQVINVLEESRNSNRDQRIRLFYGDSKTGKDWHEEHDIMGYIGRSTGSIKIPLLINNRNSYGGGAVLDHCIVKITKDKTTLYQHPKYHTDKFTIKQCKDVEMINKGYTHEVFRNGKINARFNSEQKAKNYISFMEGKRNKI